MNREEYMKTTLEFIKLTLVTVGGTLAIMFALGIASLPAQAENRIWTEDHSQTYSGKTQAGTGEKAYVKDYEHKIEGKYSEKFVLGHGDCGYDPNFNDCKSDRGRTERLGKWSKSRNVWYKFSFFIDTEWDSRSRASIAQVKTKGVRYPVWMLRVDHGLLKLEMNQLDQRCGYLLTLDKMAGKWTDVVLFVNYSKKKVKWTDEYVALWINGERVNTKGCSSEPVLGKFASSWHKKGSSFRYGIYHSYVSRELHQKAMVVGKDMKLKGWSDAHSDKSVNSKTNDPWSIDWPVKLKIKRAWFDNMQVVRSKKDIYEDLK
tara:strand:+ start:3925 stop:4875 length:951 start_codon:yes stop_codon:yes gene_type:complete